MLEDMQVRRLSAVHPTHVRRTVLERAHSQAYERGFGDQIRGVAERPPPPLRGGVVGERGHALWMELQKVQREHGATSYIQGYDDAAGVGLMIGRRGSCRETRRGTGPRRSTDELPWGNGVFHGRRAGKQVWR